MWAEPCRTSHQVSLNGIHRSSLVLPSLLYSMCHWGGKSQQILIFASCTRALWEGGLDTISVLHVMLCLSFRHTKNLLPPSTELTQSWWRRVKTHLQNCRVLLGKSKNCSGVWLFYMDLARFLCLHGSCLWKDWFQKPYLAFLDYLCMWPYCGARLNWQQHV